MTKKPLQNVFSVFAVFVIALALTLQAFFVPNVSAAQITERKLTLQAGPDGADPDSLPDDGGTKPGGTVRHFFEFTLPTSGLVGSIKFEYCTTAANSAASPACVTPTGLDTTGAGVTLSDESGATGFTLNKTTNGAPYLTRTAAGITGPLNTTYKLNNVVNPSAEGSFFVRITTHTDTAASSAATDSGTVTASTAEQIILSGTMPESLIFCAGADIAKVGGVVDCSTATPGTITFNQLFSPTATASAISEMAASTNAGFGYVITVNGPTLTSGTNTIAPITAGTGTASIKGIGQFGLNLVANTAAAAIGFDAANVTNPTPSAVIDSPSDGVNLNGRPFTGYATADTFKFDTSSGQNIVADSNFNAAGNPDPSDAQIYTVSYVTNVPGSQPAGTYTSTLTYICTPTF